MKSVVTNLLDVLNSEYDLYSKVALIEENKSEAIISKNGKELEELSMEQESYLLEIDNLEKKRDDILETYKKECYLDDINSNVSLHDIVKMIDEDSALKLMNSGIELKKLVFRIKALSDNNNKMMNDNMEFFNILVSSLKNSISIQAGYSSNGSSREVLRSSLLINKTV